MTAGLCSNRSRRGGHGNSTGAPTARKFHTSATDPDMFATCLHCHGPLGGNEHVEHFPVGRRLAFDSTKGRLWVVCRQCHRWNLSPLEERWEAIEECERLYAGTRLRASSDNIGLARIGNRFDLVRIGAPTAPEMAAWRYAREFGRRWSRNGVPSAFVAAGGLQAAYNATITTGIGPFPALAALLAVAVSVAAVRGAALRKTKIALPDGTVVRPSAIGNFRFTLEPHAHSWALATGSAACPLIVGPLAVPALRSVMTVRNFTGAPPRDVHAALDHLNTVGAPDQFIARLARASRTTGIHWYPPEISLALEMALHEDAERRALDGELAALRDEWELAEEVARIADDLLLPESVRRRHAFLAGRPST
jgi:hypothetical protein